MIPTSRRELMRALGIGGAVATAGANLDATEVDETVARAERRSVDRVAADPTERPTR